MKIIWILCWSCCATLLIGQKGNTFQVKRLKKIKQKIRQDLKGFGVQIKNVRYKGKRRAIGEFWNGDAIFQMSHGIVLSTGVAEDAQGNNDITSKTGVNRKKGQAIFKTTTNQKLYDAAVLQFDFYPNSDYISFNFVFASEDYPELSYSGLNDILIFILTLPNGEKVNLAHLPNSNQPISVATINPTTHPQYYINNSIQSAIQVENSVDTFLETNSTHQLLLTRSWNMEQAITATSLYPIQYDGFTKVLQAQSNVIPHQKHRLQIGIADHGNYIFDSAVFIEMESLHSHEDSSFQAGILKREPNYYYIIDTLSQTRIRPIIIDHPTRPSICLDQPSDLLFSYDSPNLSPTNQSLLKQLSQQLHQCPDLKLRVVGYAAAKDNQYNRKLSRERAERVKIYLIEQGIANDRIEVNWQGDGSKTTKKALAQNRRVKLQIY